MAKLNKKRTETIRSDPDFVKWVKEMSRLKSFQEKDEIKPSRITQALYRQIQKYPIITSEIKNTKLGKWKAV